MAESPVWEPPPTPSAPAPPPQWVLPDQPPIAASPLLPERPPINWGRLAEQLFAARTLAWAGGVATALGIVLLFVMAASRGWVTAPMRVGTGVLVSLVLLGVAIELDRRRWRADAILAAAGVGIAGLYASLWAAASIYHFVSAAPASTLAAVIAACAVAVAIRLRQESLAVFGIAGAMLAPVLVSREVTAGGVLYASLMLAATMPLFVRFEWRRLVSVAWLVGLGEAAALVIASRDHTGFGGPVLAIAVVSALFVCLLFLVELTPPVRERVSSLGWLIASSAFTLSLADVFLYAASRHTAGHSLAGLVLVGLMAAWALCAAVPQVVRRPHADLTDIMAAFSLTLAATATGLLAGGSALVCTWAAQSAMLVAAAERIGSRSRVRQQRITISAGVYLALATAAALMIVSPTDAHLPTFGDGSSRGSIALGAITVAGIVYCFATRWLDSGWRLAAWLLPAVALAYLPLWALSAEWAVVVSAGLAAALFGFRRSRWLMSWLPELVAAGIGWALWLSAAAVSLGSSAPIERLTAPEWSGVGDRHGLIGLAALTAAAALGTWSLRLPRRAGAEHLLAVPVASLAYGIAEALRPPHAMWAWLGLSITLAAVVHLPAIRRRLCIEPLLAAAGVMLVVGLTASWAHDHSLVALADHGTSRGWPSIAIAALAAAGLATAMLAPLHRSYALWLPYALSVQLSTMLLPGQYPLVAMAALAILAGMTTIGWPSVLRTRLVRAVIAEMAAIGAIAVTVLVLLAYETPRMLFVSSHAPATGLAAAVAASAALFVAAAAARLRARQAAWSIGRVQIATGLVYVAAGTALWTLAAAILGGEQLVAQPLRASVHDHFQQGHVAVSISWVLVGLALVIVSLRGDRRGLRIGGIALLFVALAKLFLYDLAFLTALARAVSFIATGSVLLMAALLLQRFAPQVKAALSDDPTDPPT